MINLRIITLLLISTFITSANLCAQYDTGTVIYNQTSSTNLTSIQKNYIVEDFDGDFNADVIMVKCNAANNIAYLTWHKGDGSGNFSAKNNLLNINEEHKENEIFYEDMNGDGNKDIVFQNNNTGFKVLLNDGLGNISTEINNTSAIDNLVGADLKEIADIDGDGDMDGIFFAKTDSLSVYGLSLGYCLIGYNNGTGTFSNYNYLDNNQLETHLLVETGDLDGDGNVDIVSSGVDGLFFVRLYKNTGSNSFSVFEEVKIPLTTTFANIKVKDIDNNGVDELLVETYSTVYILHGSPYIEDIFQVWSYSNQTNTFIKLEQYTWLHSYNIPSFSTDITNEIYNNIFHIQFGNQNADNNLDILSVNVPLGRLQWYLGDGTGNFNTTQTVNFNNQYGSISPALKVADIDNDSDLDVFVLMNDDTSSTLTVFKNLALTPSCVSVLDLGNTALANGIYQAGTTTISGGNVIAGNNVALKAGNRVKLQSGFKAPANSTVQVQISSCN